MDKDATEHSEVFTPEVREQLVKILEGYMPIAHQYVNTLDPKERPSDHRHLILTMRCVEFKVEKLSEVVAEIEALLEKRNYSKTMKTAIAEKVGVLKKWLETI